MFIDRFRLIATLFIIMCVANHYPLAATDANSAGALLYFKQGDQIWVLLGHERNYMEWCDFGGKKINIDKDLKETAIREIGEETSHIYDSSNVVLDGLYYTGKYHQYFAEVAFMPVPVLMHANLKMKKSEELEMNAYMWIPLKVLFDAVKCNTEPFNNVQLPLKYIPLCYNNNKKPTQKLRPELAYTLNTLRNNKKLCKQYFK
jgi:hypothetical protein